MSLCSPLLERHPARPSSTKTLSAESFPDLSDPWHLPWCHKRLISDRFLAVGAAFTHYIHVEDDILLSFDNFRYFIRYRELLRNRRLIPSFQRVEFNSNDNRLYLVDQIGVSDVASLGQIDLDNFRFVNPEYPHNAMFILDKNLALEYVNTRSFDRERSMDVRPQWGLCERASMGLCFENPPDGFSCRYVIPVDPATLKSPYWSWVYHVASKYTKNPRVPFGKTQPAQLFSRDTGVINWSRPTRVDNAIWRLKHLPARLWHGRPPSTGQSAMGNEDSSELDKKFPLKK
jgi:hypothetical protein